MPERINRTISILYRYGQRFLSAKLRPLGLEVGQFPALMRVYSAPGITQEQIAVETGMDKGTTARSVQRLEECGFVRREADLQDRRLNHIYPTERAAAIRERVTAVIEEFHAILYRGMSGEEVERAAAAVNQMKRNLSGYFQENGRC